MEEAITKDEIKDTRDTRDIREIIDIKEADIREDEEKQETVGTYPGAGEQNVEEITKKEYPVHITPPLHTKGENVETKTPSNKEGI